MGRHVAAGGSASEGAHGIVGPGKKFGAVMQMRYRAPIFILNSIQNFLPCGTMSHMFLTFCRRRGHTEGIGFDHDGGDRVDPSPRDRKSSMCVNVILSGRDRKAH